MTEVVRRARGKGCHSVHDAWKLVVPYDFCFGKWHIPAASGRDRNHQRGQLEPEDGCELHSSRAATAQERIADSYVAGGSDGVGTRANLLIIAVGGKA